MAGVALTCLSGCNKNPPLPNTKAETTKPPEPIEAASPTASQIAEEVKVLARHGKLDESRRKALSGLKQFGEDDPYYQWLFTLYQDPGPAQAWEAFLTRPFPNYVLNTKAQVKNLFWRAAEHPQHAEADLKEALRVAKFVGDGASIAQAQFRLAHLKVKLEPKRFEEAGLLLEPAVQYYRAHPDSPLFPLALVNLGFSRMRLDRHDESIALSREAEKFLKEKPDQLAIANNENNLGWSLLQLGNTMEAFQHFTTAAVIYKKSAMPDKLVAILRNQAAYFIAVNQPEQAVDSLTEAAAAAASDEQKAAVLKDQAELELLLGRPEDAAKAIAQARALSQFKDAIRSQDDAHIVFIEALLADKSNRNAEADAGYRRVLASKLAGHSTELEVMIDRAALLSRDHRPADADAQYRTAAALLESMRGSLKEDESKLSFFATSRRLFDDYVHFLVSQNRPEEALKVADDSRARLLSDYRKDAGFQGLDLPRLKRRLNKDLALFYWIGAKHAYLWIIDRDTCRLIDLKDPGQIQLLSKVYFDAIQAPKISPESVAAGAALQKLILEPVFAQLTPDRHVYMVLDGRLGLINPEALKGVRSPWLIQDVIISVAPSLALLQRAPPKQSATRNLLAIGDAMGTSEFPALPNAAAELKDVMAQFQSNSQLITGKDATPAAYKQAKPGQFERIHFTAHGKSEARNPLDSAVVLSPDPGTSVYKLYARDIMKDSLNARLVTISACKSAVSRSYDGEGVVGLAWAFLRAGAGQVVAGLWNVSDETARELMKRFYERMHDGKSPAHALREAKLDLMNGYKRPYDWAVFEIFAGYVEP